MSTSQGAKKYQEVLNLVRQQYRPSEAKRDAVYKAVTGAPAVTPNPPHGTGLSTATLLKGIGAIAVVALVVTVWSTPQHPAISQSSVDNSKLVPGEIPSVRFPDFSANLNVPVFVRSGESTSDIELPPSASPSDRKALQAHAASNSRKVLSSAPPATDADTLADELKILSRATASLNAGNSRSAMALLEKHRRAFPNGVMAEERNGLEIITLCKSGQIDRARKKYIRFRHRAPDSPTRLRIQTTCGFQ